MAQLLAKQPDKKVGWCPQEGPGKTWVTQISSHLSDLVLPPHILIPVLML